MISLWLFLFLACRHIEEVYPLLHVTFSGYKDNYRLYIRVGKPSISYSYVLLDITSPYTIFLFSWSISSISETSEIVNPIHTLTVSNNTFKVIEVSDFVELGEDKDVVISEVHFYCLEETEENKVKMKDGLGLAFHLDDNSFMNQLKLKGLISSMSFSFTNSTAPEASMYFGGIPENITLNKHSSYCKVKSQSAEWSCLLNEVRFNGTTFVNDAYSYFSTSIALILTPEKFFNEFYQVYFRDSFKRKECSINFRMGYKYMIACEKEFVANFTNVDFILGDYLYSFTPDQLFDCNYRLCNFALVPNTNPFEWVIGVPFLKAFDTLFDYDREMVVFYSETPIPKLDIKPIKKEEGGRGFHKFLAVACLIVLLLGSVVVLMRYKCDINKP